MLRADRCISANSLEGRVPFADLDFVEYVMSLDPDMKMNHYDKGKYLLRMAFAGQDYLPDDILMREKAAFSDAVGHSLVDDLKEYADAKYTDEDVAKASEKYAYKAPLPRNPCSTATYLKNSSRARPNGSRTTGCQTATGKVVTLTTHPLAFSPTTGTRASKKCD